MRQLKTIDVCSLCIFTPFWHVLWCQASFLKIGTSTWSKIQLNTKFDEFEGKLRTIASESTWYMIELENWSLAQRWRSILGRNCSNWVLIVKNRFFTVRRSHSSTPSLFARARALWRELWLRSSWKVFLHVWTLFSTLLRTCIHNGFDLFWQILVCPPPFALPWPRLTKTDAHYTSRGWNELLK